MTHWIRVAVISLLAAGLAVGFGGVGQIWGLILTLLLGVGWILVGWPPKNGAWTTRPDLDGIGLLVFVGLIAWGLVAGLPAWQALGAVLLALAAWDLGRFIRRLALALNPPAVVRLERLHLVRLGLALGAGLLVGGLALGLRISLDFGWALGLGIVAIFALSRAARGLLVR